MWVGPDGRRYFTDGDTCDGGHQPGDRHDDGYTLLELTEAGEWTPVCAVDDVAMMGRDGDGWLCCGVCGQRAAGAAR